MIDLSTYDLSRLSERIKELYNYDFTEYAQASLKRRVIRILDAQEMQSVDELIDKISTDTAYFRKFLSEITVNVTEMFRDPFFWKELKENILPELLNKHGNLRIWHAGCSSGEEVFSMAILLKEMGALDKVELLASDIDKNILIQAHHGKYPLKNMDVNNKNYIRFEGKKELANYYEIRGNFAHFDSGLIENVTLKKHNLAVGEGFEKFHLILCRNVMIYFNQYLQNRVLKLLHESLEANGYLAVGAKESLAWCEISDKFEPAHSEEKIYRKIG